MILQYYGKGCGKGYRELFQKKWSVMLQNPLKNEVLFATTMTNI